MQSISGSDVFGHVHWTATRDLGQTWAPPEPIPGLGRAALGDGWEMGTCDVVPEHHAPTRTVLAVGHNVYYRVGVLARPQRARWPVYAVRSSDGTWSKPQRLAWDDPRGRAIYTCGCSQRVVLENGDVLMPLSFGSVVDEPRSVTTALCAFDGRSLNIKNVGTVLTAKAGRGLLEPSLTRHGGRFYLTIRAEDERGYVASSDDGLRWGRQAAWAWDDGEPLVMSTTQQHWLPHSNGLFLVYTRKAAQNANVVRWRAPLFVARVDTERLRLVRASEREILPLIGDGIKDPKHVALMGNFHVAAVTEHESWVTVGENRPNDGYHGDALIAKVRWDRPNRVI